VVDRLTAVLNEQLGELSSEALSEEIDDPNLKNHLEDLGYM
jgi:NTP pyrophosphatase (non-canonical NTP hydrolase)